MLKKLIGTLAVATLIAAPARQAAAQLAVGYTDLGVVAGLGGIGEASLALGGRFERVIKDLPNMGGGTLGIGISVDRYAYSYKNFGYGFDYSYIPIGATGNYHIKLENKKIDAYVGAGLGYEIISCDYSGIGGSADLCSSSALYFIGRVGGRYFFSDKMALYGDAGAGAATLNVGVTFKLGGK